MLVTSRPVRNQSVIEQPDSHNLQDTSQHDMYVATRLDGFQQQNRRRGRFSTVARKHHKSYVIKGIGLDSDLEGLDDFFTNDMRITYRSVNFLVTSRKDCKVAQIVVDTVQAEKIDESISWPEGISCRP
ncbi:hypothetical protein DPMN_121213 [Dreissena polymorpha]|uniref:Uncharacterized protein n=1 Tax=Dreissena polymorpha TaxID=45954 RepID=A0A9D4GQ38_DREPO|nr:hypothetical protein DPMN_121213 [Dreissena polymorpha]